MNICKIISGVVNTPIGLYKIQVCKTGVHTILLAGAGDENIKPNNSSNSNHEDECTGMLDNCKRWLESYFQKDAISSSPSDIEAPAVCYEGIKATDFERHVWKTLQATKMGKTLTYGELATLAENPKAARAVGSAMKKNPVTILIPCHRVVRSDYEKTGSLGNYSGGGPQNKEWLINHENVKIQ